MTRCYCFLVLEFFLFCGCEGSDIVHELSSSSDTSKAGTEPSISVEEAKVPAITWKNQLLAEGRVPLASAVDALGLALFVAPFDIRSEFDTEIMYDRFQIRNMKKADILLRSWIIVEKLPGMLCSF